MEEPRAHLVTYLALRRSPDDGIRRELIDGEVIEMPGPAVDHQTVIARLLVLLYTHVTSRNLGFVFPAPIDVYLSPHNVPQPDITYVSNANRGIVRRGNLHGPPDLCIEVISLGSKRRDRVTKRNLYARFGVKEYWIIDPIAQTIEMLGLTRTRSGRRMVSFFSPLDSSAVLPTLTLDLPALLTPAFPD